MSQHAYLIAWPCVGILIHALVTFLDAAAIDLHLPRSWWLFLTWIPVSAICGPFMILGVIVTPPRWWS